MDNTDTARLFLNEIARLNYGDLAKFQPMRRQAPDNLEALRYGVAGWFLRPLWISPALVFVEARIDDRSRFVGCPNPPLAYLVKHGEKVVRFRNYGRALRYCAIRALRERLDHESV
jgi:hypothetical protein